jgi:hypothetical protein
MLRLNRKLLLAPPAALLALLCSAGLALALTAGWRVTPSPNQGGRSNALLGVAAASSRDVWSVGEFTSGISVNSLRTLAEHWTGASWSIVPTPNPATGTGDYDSLRAVSALSGNDAWATGYSGNANFVADRTLIEHWNGAEWSVVASPNPYTSQELYGVSAVSSGDIWAVGQYANYGPSAYGGLIERWNGSQWSEVPNPATYGLYGVAALSASNAWAVGGPQILHWDGSSWRVVPSPQPQNGGGYQLRAIAAVSANDVWAVGYREVPSGEGYFYDTLIEHWNGTSWTLSPGVEPDLGYDYLFGVTARTSTSVWAVGSAGGRSFVEKFNGARWTRASTPNVGTSNNTLQAATVSPDTGDAWAVGEFYEAKSPYNARTLVQECVACQ